MPNLCAFDVIETAQSVKYDPEGRLVLPRAVLAERGFRGLALVSCVEELGVDDTVGCEGGGGSGPVKDWCGGLGWFIASTSMCFVSSKACQAGAGWSQGRWAPGF